MSSASAPSRPQAFRQSTRVVTFTTDTAQGAFRITLWTHPETAGLGWCFQNAASRAQKEAFKRLTPEMVRAAELAGEPILQKLTHAPGNGAAIGGLKVVSKSGWFAARPSGTEEIYKIYAESFLGQPHLRRIQEEAQSMVSQAFRQAGA